MKPTNFSGVTKNEHAGTPRKKYTVECKSICPQYLSTKHYKLQNQLRLIQSSFR